MASGPPWPVSSFRFRARLGFSIPFTLSGPRGITPAFGYGALSATLPAQPDPRGLSVGACHATGRASRVATNPLLHTCHRQYPGGTGRCSRRSLPDRWQPSPFQRRVGFRIVRFEACSAFTRVVACVVAEPPEAALCHRSASDDVVTSTIRSDCYRLERHLPGGIRRMLGARICWEPGVSTCQYWTARPDLPT